MKYLLLVLLVFAQAVYAQKHLAAGIHSYMQAQERVNGFTGVVLLVKDGKTLYQSAFGLASREWGIPNTLTTKFRIGSITKQFTAAAVLQLVAAGRLSLSDRLSRFYPDFPKGDSVTLHMLLNHTSGIKSFTSLPEFGKLEGLMLPKDSIIALFRNQPYDFSPGSRYAYNNSAYFLLATIIEKQSGLSYETYLKKYLLDGVGLANTGVEKTDSITTQAAVGYRLTPGGWKKSKPISMEFPLGGGNLLSTVEDLYQWQQALLGGKVLPDSLLLKMTTPYLSRYGYALDIDSLGTQKRIGHDGNIAGFASYCYYFPQEKLSVVVLSNKQGGVQGLGQALAAIMFGMPVLEPYVHQEKTIDPSLLDQYIGTYQTPEHLILDIIKEGDKLYRKTGANRVELKAESPTQFFWTGGTDAQIYFEKEKGELKAFFVRDGLVRPLKKIK